jgi:myosin heavy subunit
MSSHQVFIKAPVTVFELERCRAKVIPELATSLSKCMRGKLARLAFLKDMRGILVSQSLVRTFNEKKRFQKEMRKVLLVVTIVRGLLSRLRTKQKRLQFKNKPPRVYALVVQKRFRGNRSRLALSTGIREKCAACAFRAK